MKQDGWQRHRIVLKCAMPWWGSHWIRAAILSLLLGCACERRVSEPPKPTMAQAPAIASAGKVARAETSATAKRAQAQKDPAAAKPRAAKAKAVNRCMVPTPPKPLRAAPPPGPDPRCPSDPDGGGTLRLAKVHVDREAGQQPVTVKVEVAESNDERMRGLMYRRQLAEEKGMLFVFEQRRPLSFWMKNTCLPLDMLFIDSDGFVVAIEENVPTMNERTYGPRCPARMVLEVNAGWARRNGVRAGHRVRLDGVLRR